MQRQFCCEMIITAQVCEQILIFIQKYRENYVHTCRSQHTHTHATGRTDTPSPHTSAHKWTHDQKLLLMIMIQWRYSNWRSHNYNATTNMSRTQAWVGFLTEWWVGFSKYMFVFLVYARKINYHKSIPPWVPCKLRKTVVEKWCGLCLGRHKQCPQMLSSHKPGCPLWVLVWTLLICVKAPAATHTLHVYTVGTHIIMPRWAEPRGIR